MYKFRSLLLLIFILSFSFSMAQKEPIDIVREYITQSNAYNYEEAIKCLSDAYYESYLVEFEEIKNLDHLREFFGWRREMQSECELLAIEAKDETVTTIERTYNYMDSVLNRKKRTFKITYTIASGKISSSNIDTLSGHSAISAFNWNRYEDFQKYCEDKGLYTSLDMNAEDARQLKRNLEVYSKNKN